jgi:predicted alpha/beta-fold hydrolase
MIIDSRFIPARFCGNTHWQTMWPTFLTRRKKAPFTYRERLYLQDGDFIDLEWHAENFTEKNTPIILLFHGVTGNLSAPYIKYMMPVLAKQGYRSVMMYYRGYSGEHNRLNSVSHAGQTDDIGVIINELYQREPNTVLVAIGFSQGANMLLKYLGEVSNHSPLRCAVAVSPPFELRSMSSRIRRGMGSFYQWFLLRQIKAFYRQKFEYRRSFFEPKSIESIQSFWELDDRITAPLHGFKSAIDYYRKSSCIHFLKTIGVHTLIIHAMDDPIMTEEIIPKEHQLSPVVTLELSKKGGHLGFVEGSIFRPRFFLAKRIPDYIRAQLLHPETPIV